MADNREQLIFLGTLIFLIAPVFLLVYIFTYNRRKKRHLEEKALMKLMFEAELIKAQLEVQEQTMQTIGADLHDNVGQLLSLTSLILNSIDVDNQYVTRRKVDDVIDLTHRSIKEMRLLGKLLQGDQLILMGLENAIKYEITYIEKSNKYNINYKCDTLILECRNQEKDLILFRIVQEALNNIIKHAQADRIDIELKHDQNIIMLQISDNGLGFDSSALLSEKRGMGLANIHKRVDIINGAVVISSSHGCGTKIVVNVPYP